MKNFFLSKINWLGFVTVLIGLQDFIGTWNFSAMTIKSWATFVIGIAVIVIRTYFTSTAIGTKPKA